MDAQMLIGTLAMFPHLLQNVVSAYDLHKPVTMCNALIKYGGGIVQMSGSIAGQVHARNRFGNYMRARTKPVNPNSDRQTGIRATMALLSEEWADALNDAERTAWNSYAAAVPMTNKLGEVIHLTGFNHFIRSNIPRLEAVHAIVTAGPVVMALPSQDPTLAIAVNGATNQITVTFDDTMDWCTEDDAFLWVHLATPQNPTRTFCDGPWRRNMFLEGVDPGGIASPFGPAGINAWTFATGQRVFAKARIQRADGRLSGEFRPPTVLAS